ncbi:MetQ/NlpA family ABC transporter substrate-binding protein [Kocuria palustris]|uniref:MetQ/NlpA family ABC transporter substrate-binding protein n=1 Tax=Kocuria palustris TaxID=71999 RepID=UPI0028CBA81D|nr:MetQ/NlpA family ABC transporter substrate-binding protein [Kocuria palustris]
MALTTVLGLTLAGCGGSGSGGSGDAPYDDGVIQIGVVGTTPVNEALVEKAEEEGITVELVELSEYSQVNPATKSGDVDMNWFQHAAYLADYNNSSGDSITPIASTSIYPLGLYSNSYDSLEEIQDGDEIAIPNDSINQSRALLLLEANGLVEFTSETTAPTESDVDTESSKVTVTPVSAEQTVLSLDSVAGSVINNDFLARGDIDPDSALATDGAENENARPYVNLFATTEANKDDETLHQVADLFHTPEVEEAEKEDSKGTAVTMDLSQEELEQILSDYQQDLQQ